MKRTFGILFGLATHALFAFTVWHLFWFLKGRAGDPGIVGPGVSGEAIDGIGHRVLADVGLALAFTIPHSLLLVPGMRNRIVGAGVTAPFYGCFYCVATCLTLLFTIGLWQPIDVVVWEWPAPLGMAVSTAFVASWAALFYSLHLTGLGWQTGWTPWWRWVRGLEPARRMFVVKGAYRFLRHPVYMSFLGLIWFVPVVTVDRAVLIVIWSGYILVGSALKDRRLLFFLGDEYRGYQARVPGYPGMPAGPLARVPLTAAPVSR